MAPGVAAVVLLLAVLAFADAAIAEGVAMLVLAGVLAVPWPTSDGRPRGRRRRRWAWWVTWTDRD